MYAKIILMVPNTGLNAKSFKMSVRSWINFYYYLIGPGLKFTFPVRPGPRINGPCKTLKLNSPYRGLFPCRFFLPSPIFKPA